MDFTRFRRAAGGAAVAGLLAGGLITGTGAAWARDDDPGGHPCTNQSGAPGYYIWDGNQWICNITGNAPRVHPKPKPKPPPPAPAPSPFGS